MEVIKDEEDRWGRRKLIRFTLTERLFHWAYALPFTVLGISGVLHKLRILGWGGWGSPAFLEGIHRGAAVALVLAPLGVLLLGNREALRQSSQDLTHWEKEDSKWFSLFLLGPFRGRPRVVSVGRFNAGQKVNALISSSFILALMLSGGLVWAQKGNGVLLPTLVHQFLAFLFIPFFGGHLFLALFNPSTRRALPGMMVGKVDVDWAREHHPRWVEEVAWDDHPGIHFRGRVGLKTRHVVDLLWESERYCIRDPKKRKAILKVGARTLLGGSFPVVTAWNNKKLAGIGWAVTDLAFHAFICDVIVRKNGLETNLEGEILRRLQRCLTVMAKQSSWATPLNENVFHNEPNIFTVSGQDIQPFARPEKNHFIKEEADMSCRSYFEEFLPQTLGKSLVARIESLHLVLAFSIEGEGGGDWTLVLEGGKLAEINEGSKEGVEIRYRLDEHSFLEVVSGKLSPQKAFFSGRVKIEGDILKALKMAVIFQGFFREYPFMASQLSS